MANIKIMTKPCRFVLKSSPMIAPGMSSLDYYALNLNEN